MSGNLILGLGAPKKNCISIVPVLQGSTIFCSGLKCENIFFPSDLCMVLIPFVICYLYPDMFSLE